MVTDQLVNSGSDEYSIFLFTKDFKMLLRSEDREDARYDAWASCKLVLTNLIKAECPDCVGDCLDDLRKGVI